MTTRLVVAETRTFKGDLGVRISLEYGWLKSDVLHDMFPDRGGRFIEFQRNRGHRYSLLSGRMTPEGDVEWRSYYDAAGKGYAPGAKMTKFIEQNANALDYLIQQHGERLSPGTYVVKDVPRHNPSAPVMLHIARNKDGSVQVLLRYDRQNYDSLVWILGSSCSFFSERQGQRTDHVSGKVSQYGDVSWKRLRQLSGRPSTDEQVIAEFVERHSSAIDYLIDIASGSLPSGDYTVNDPPRMNPSRRRAKRKKRSRYAQLCTGGVP